MSGFAEARGPVGGAHPRLGGAAGAECVEFVLAAVGQSSAAPRPVVKEPSGRQPGAQPGHQAFQRIRLPAEHVQHTIPLLPDRCGHCQSPLPAQAGPDDPEPSWHQIAELPRVAAVVTEYEGHARTCSDCGRVTRHEISQALRRHGIGEPLGAALSFLNACPHVSKRWGSFAPRVKTSGRVIACCGRMPRAV
jgi:hypothetical protein